MVQSILLGAVEESKMNIELSWLSKQSHICKESSYMHNEVAKKTNSFYESNKSSGNIGGEICFRLVVREGNIVTFIGEAYELGMKDK